jgi:hypothetical protein
LGVDKVGKVLAPAVAETAGKHTTWFAKLRQMFYLMLQSCA